jgi:metal-sulfur cluster biosynthetic enzyme
MNESTINEEKVLEKLKNVVCPCAQALTSGYDIEELGLVNSIEISGRNVSIDLRLTQPACLKGKYISSRAKANISELEGVETVSVETDDGWNWTPDMMSEKMKQERQEALEQQLQNFE